MSRNYYSEIHVHVVWHTTGSRPLLTPAIESQVFEYIRSRCNETSEVKLRAIGGVADHIDLALTIPPTLQISEFIGRLKGGSSHEINHSNPTRDKLLQWQTGYGVVSFGTKALPWVVQYVNNQKVHHQSQTAIERLERMADLESPINGAGES